MGCSSQKWIEAFGRRLFQHLIDLANNLAALRHDPEVMKYIGKTGAIQSREEVEKFLDDAIQYYKKHGFGFCSVFEKSTEAFVGQAGLFHLGFDESQPEIEIAYRLHKKFWSMGYATELAKALIYWGFEHLAIDRLIAVTKPKNSRSRRVLDKAGMDYAGESEYLGVKICRYEIYKNDSIQLIPYDEDWPKIASLEINKLYEILPKKHVIDIQHVGSTAIPGMLAKPIIDIQVAVDALINIKDEAISVLEAQNYVYSKDNPDLTRLFFVKGMPPFGKGRTHHVHIAEPTSKHWQGKIAFRDYLTAHPEAAKKYEVLKMNLAKLHTYDREQYTEAKTEFIVEILQKAGVKWR